MSTEDAPVNGSPVESRGASKELKEKLLKRRSISEVEGSVFTSRESVPPIIAPSKSMTIESSNNGVTLVDKAIDETVPRGGGAAKPKDAEEATRGVDAIAPGGTLSPIVEEKVSVPHTTGTDGDLIQSVVDDYVGTSVDPNVKHTSFPSSTIIEESRDTWEAKISLLSPIPVKSDEHLLTPSSSIRVEKRNIFYDDEVEDSPSAQAEGKNQVISMKLDYDAGPVDCLTAAISDDSEDETADPKGSVDSREPPVTSPSKSNHPAIPPTQPITKLSTRPPTLPSPYPNSAIKYNPRGGASVSVENPIPVSDPETSSVPLSNSKGMMHYLPNMHSGSTLLVSPEVVGRLGKVIEGNEGEEVESEETASPRSLRSNIKVMDTGGNSMGYLYGRGGHVSKRKGNAWSLCYTTDGVPYYYNSELNISQWNKPSSYDQGGPLSSSHSHTSSRVSEGGGSTLMERKKSRDIIGLSSLRLTKCGGKSKIDGDTILHSAVSYGYVDDTYVLDLLAKGVDVSTIVNCDGETPLHYACYYCYYFGIQVLLEAGCSMDTKDSYGRTPLFSAALATSCTKEYLSFLDSLTHKLDYTITDCEGNSLLHVAAASGNTECQSYILEREKERSLLLNMKNHDGDTPLHIAAGAGQEASVGLLLSYGASNDVVNAGGESSWRKAYNAGYTSIALLLPVDEDFMEDARENEREGMIRELKQMREKVKVVEEESHTLRTKLSASTSALSRVSAKYDRSVNDCEMLKSEILKLNKAVAAGLVKEGSLERQNRAAVQSQQEAWRLLQDEKEKVMTLTSTLTYTQEEASILRVALSEAEESLRVSRSAHEAWESAYSELESKFKMSVTQQEVIIKDLQERLQMIGSRGDEVEEMTVFNRQDDHPEESDTTPPLFSPPVHDVGDEEIKTVSGDMYNYSYDDPLPMTEPAGDDEGVVLSAEKEEEEEEDPWEAFTTETGFVYYYNHGTGEYWSETNMAGGGDTGGVGSHHQSVASPVTSSYDGSSSPHNGGSDNDDPSSPAFRSSKTRNFFNTFRASYIGTQGEGEGGGSGGVYSSEGEYQYYDEGRDHGGSRVNYPLPGIPEDTNIYDGESGYKHDVLSLAPGAYDANEIKGEDAEVEEQTAIPTSPERVVKVWERFFENSFKRKMSEEIQRDSSLDQVETFFDAVRDFDIKQVLDLLQAKNGEKLLTLTDDLQNTALHYAAAHEDVSIISLLIDNGADLNPSNIVGNTPLHESVINQSQVTCKYLLESMCEVNLQNHEGDTPLHLAVKSLSLNLVKLLLTYDAQRQIVNGEGNTPLDIVTYMSSTSEHHVPKSQVKEIFLLLLEGRSMDDGRSNEPLDGSSSSTRHQGAPPSSRPSSNNTSPYRTSSSPVAMTSSKEEEGGTGGFWNILNPWKLVDNSSTTNTSADKEGGGITNKSRREGGRVSTSSPTVAHLGRSGGFEWDEKNRKWKVDPSLLGSEDPVSSSRGGGLKSEGSKSSNTSPLHFTSAPPPPRAPPIMSDGGGAGHVSMSPLNDATATGGGASGKSKRRQMYVDPFTNL